MTKRNIFCAVSSVFLVVICTICLVQESRLKKLYREIEEIQNRPDPELSEEEKEAIRKEVDSMWKDPIDYRIDRVIPALIEVESNGNDSAIGDEGQAVGCLQIHPIMVREVNRILKKDKFTEMDRYDRKKSIDMCRVYLRHWGLHLYGNDASEEKLARLWNGGTNTVSEKTNKYWAKVQRQIQEKEK